MIKKLSLLLFCILTAIPGFPYEVTVDGITYSFTTSGTLYTGMEVEASVKNISEDAIMHMIENRVYYDAVHIPGKVELQVRYKSNNTYKFATVNATVVSIFPNIPTVSDSFNPAKFDYVEIPETVQSVNTIFCSLCGVTEMDIYSRLTSYDFLNPLKTIAGSKVTLPASECIKIEESGDVGEITLLPNDINYNNSEYRFSSVSKDSEKLIVTLAHRGDMVTNRLTATFNGRVIEPKVDNSQWITFEISGEGYHIGEINVDFSDGVNDWTLPFCIKGEVHDMSEFRYEFDKTNKTATLIGFTDELKGNSELEIPSFLGSISTDGECVIYTVEKIAKRALFKSSLRTLTVPETVKTVGELAFGSISKVVFLGGLSDYGILPKIGCRTLYFPAEELVEINRADIQLPDDFSLSPTEIYQLGGTLSCYCKGLMITVPKSSNISMRYGNEDIAGVENKFGYKVFTVRNSDCYPGNIIDVTIVNDGEEQTLPFILPKNDPIIFVSAGEIRQCDVITSVSNSFPDELYGPDSSGIRINTVGSDSYREIDAKQMNAGYDYSYITIGELVPGTNYNLVPYGVYNGHKIYWDDAKETFKTNSVDLSFEILETYSKVLKVAVKVTNSDGSGTPSELGLISQYSINDIDVQDEYGVTTLQVADKYLREHIHFVCYAKYNGSIITVNTPYSFPLKLKADIITRETPTGFDAWIVNNDPYYEVNDENVDWSFSGKLYNDGVHFSIRGLKPEEAYSINALIGGRQTSGNVNPDFTLGTCVSTTELELEPLPCETASNTCAILKAKTNVDINEAGMGFEWRRYDAPPEMPSTFSPCAVSEDGYMGGKLHNLSTSTYYKFRPYYKDSEGNIHYSKEANWIAFITADAYVYFEPIVYTYGVKEVGDDIALLRGYALAGSDEIIQQGFEYWVSNGSGKSSFNKASAEVEDVMRVITTGQQMQATVRGLKSGTDYCYRSFVESAKGVTYGSEISFTTTGTPDTSGIEDIIDDTTISEDSGNDIYKIFNIQGVEMSVLQKGINIVIYKNGTVRKVVVK